VKEIKENIRYKFFDDGLPRKYKGIDWAKSIGLNLKIIYEYEMYEFKILDFDKDSKKVCLEYNNQKTKPINISNLKRCAIGSLIGKITKDFKINISDNIKDSRRDLIIIDREYRKGVRGKSKINAKYYKYHCNKCGYEGWVEEGSLITQKSGCACCCPTPRVAVLGINTIWDTDRWMCDLGVSEEDAKKHTKGSNKKVIVKCPDCNNEKKVMINYIYKNKSISCTCGDGFSYPQKFMNSVLTQLNLVFETEYSPDYLIQEERRRYSDFYLPDYKTIIETDGGLGHKGGKVHHKSKKSLEELIKIDDWKDEQHLKNGVKTIRINCFESDMEYIKNGILNSELGNIFDLSKIDWNKCEKFAMNNLVKEVCDGWNNKEEWETTKDLAEKFKLHKSTIIKYLKKGNKINLCNYNPKEEMVKSGLKNLKKHFKHAERLNELGLQ